MDTSRPMLKSTGRKPVKTGTCRVPPMAVAAALLLAGFLTVPGAASAAGPEATLPATATWAGKYPFDAKPNFFANPALRKAGSALLGDKRWAEVTGKWSTAAPIQADGDALLAWTCKPHDCGDNQQATLIDGDRVAVCLTEAGVSRWYIEPGGRPSPAGPKGCNFETTQQARDSLAAAS